MSKAGAAVFIDSIGLAAPGLPNWPASQDILCGTQAYAAVEMPWFAPSFLPPNERRRATRVGRLAFQAGEEAVAGTDIPPEHLAAVFASSGGDTEVMDRLCRALATTERGVSPTDFHNSVHNAPAGYWSIATRSRLPSTSLSAYDSSFAAGLMEAASLCRDEQLPVLLVTYDIRPPAPLVYARPLLGDFSVALLLTPAQRLQSRASLQLSLANTRAAESRVPDAGLESLRCGNPAARALPLLVALAKQEFGTLQLPYLENCLTVDVRPC